MTFVDFLELLKSDIASYREGRFSLNSLVRSLEAIEQLHVRDDENSMRSRILELVSDLETVNAIILFDEKRAENLQLDIRDLLFSIENIIDDAISKGAKRV